MAARGENIRCRIAPAAKLALLSVSLVLALPAIVGLAGDNEDRTRRENRTLAALPEFRSAENLAGYFSSLEDWIDDHMGFVGPVNEVYRKVQFYGFRDRPVPNVDVGAEGFVFLNSHQADNPNARYRTYCEPAAPRIRMTTNALSRLGVAARRTGIALTVAVVPSKVSLYPERLPVTVDARWRNACQSLTLAESLPGQVAQGLSGAPVRFVYPLASISARKNSLDYYPPGNFHADSRINHDFSHIVLDAMGIPVGDGYDVEGTHRVVGSDIAVLGFRRRAPAWTFSYGTYGVEPSRQKPVWINEYFPRTNDFGMFETANPASERVALMLSNSFGMYMAPHLAPGFRRLYHVSMNNFTAPLMNAGIGPLIEGTAPTDLVILLHDGGFNAGQLMNLAEAIETWGQGRGSE